MFSNALFYSFDLNLPFDILFRFDINIFCSIFASSSFISPDCVFQKNSIALSKSLAIF